MKAFVLFLMFCPLLAWSQKEPREFEMTEGDTTYTMKRYYMCFLKKGPNRNMDEKAAMAIQKAHMASIDSLAQIGKVVMAGPFGDDGDVRGILIYDVETQQEAEILAAGDPAVKAGSLILEVHPWWAAKGTRLP